MNKLRREGVEDQYIVDSAGTGGWHVGRLADSRMRKAALKRGINIESRARQICATDFQEFDLVLTMDNSNFADVNSLYQEIKPTSKVEIRPFLSYAENTNLLEVPDPYYGGDEGFDDVLDLLDDAVNGLFICVNQ
ncbi:Low molecular weight protein tyrosine phosphatasee [Prochlorococcus sp. MIT 0601]|nr:Low molecular weight protein tyrosine phosphatasee [Prochlorococcus sp. MIT 0601]